MEKKNMEKKNIAMILTAPETKKKSKKPSEPKKQYGLPKGFKLIGFDITI